MRRIVIALSKPEEAPAASEEGDEEENEGPPPAAIVIARDREVWEGPKGRIGAPPVLRAWASPRRGFPARRLRIFR